MNNPANYDPAEIARFDAQAQRWWDTQGEFRPLHEINPVRIAYVNDRSQLQGKRVLDIGCGGGLAAEAMARCGARVTGIDLGANTIEVAQLHALSSGLKIEYLRESAEDHAVRQAGDYDVVTCLEMLEHVPDPLSVIRAIAQLARPGGHVFLSTINRNLKAYLHAVIGAEYLLRLIPRGTHTYARFIKPFELARWTRSAGLALQDVSSIDYDPLTHRSAIGFDPSVNYIMHLSREHE